MEKLKIDFNALRKGNWSNEEVENVKLVIDFVQHLMNEHDFDYIARKFGPTNYIQHNRSIPNGIEALIEYVKGFAKRYSDYTYDVKHIYADGDFVIFHSQATLNGKHRGNDSKGLNIIDIWRTENGQIAEHWDALQPMDGFMRFFNLINGGSVKNANGVY
jgi:predicted SnoaL-like aldol condensation-catalyzing enzyme